MLTTHALHIDGRRHTLVPATTLESRRAEVLLVQADGQESRTAAALALSGRMKPSSGSVALGHDGSMASLRRRSALVDAPGVNAPERHLTVRSLTSEDLALVQFKFRDRTRPTEWLVKNGFRDILDKWVEELEPQRLLHLQLELALANHDVELLVVDSPDRHTSNPAAWLPLLQQAAAGELGVEPLSGNPPRTILVIALVGQLPPDWDGPTSFLGNDMGTPAVEAVPAEAVPAGVEQPAAEAPATEALPAVEEAPEPAAVEAPAVEALPAVEGAPAGVEAHAVDTEVEESAEAPPPGPTAPAEIAVTQTDSKEIQ